jgi:uncharacterized coiled-coil protein SlyX
MQATESHENRITRLEALAETTLLAIAQLVARQNETDAQIRSFIERQEVTDAQIQAVTTGLDELADSVRELRAGQEHQSRLLDYLLGKEQERQNEGESSG